MSTTRVGTVAALIAGLALSASPLAAQDRQDSGGRRERSAQGGRRNPNAGNQGGGDNGGQRNRGQAQADRGDRGNRDGGNNSAEARRDPQPRAEAQPRNDARGGDRDRNDGRRADRNDSTRDRNGDRGGNRDWNRDRDRGRPVVIVPRGRDYRYSPRYSGRSYYDARRPRVYAVPYGYRQNYRPGWSLNLYFGRPYGYGTRGYYGNGNYGYYDIPRGFAYGSLRIVDAPRDAQVFVDGYYAGIVDDYDGVFEHLNLEPGTHRIEIEVYPGEQPLEFDVAVAPGQTVTYHARY